MTVDIPRPPNAFILYRKEHHKAVKEEKPELNNNEISVILGQKWREESDETRVNFHMLASAIKRQVEQMHPGYKYKPRRFAKIRRRRRRNEGVNNMNTAVTVQAAEATVQAAEATVQAAEATVQAAEATVQATEATVQAAEATVQAAEATVQAAEAIDDCDMFPMENFMSPDSNAFFDYMVDISGFRV